MQSLNSLFKAGRKYAMVGGSLLAIALTAGPAYAQDQAEDAGGLQDIVVTAQKRSENLQKVPIAIAAVSGEQLAATGITSTNALSSAVPGVSLNTTAQNFSPHIRGIGTTAFGIGVENPVALVVDGVYYASALMGLADLSDVDQVAVLKGPQGTLFGRNATGGVIQLTTREPKDDFGGEIRSELDQYMTSRNFLYVTGGVTDDLKGNLSVKYATQGEGWGKNIQTGQDVHKIDYDVQLRSKWNWTASDSTTVKLALDYAKQKNSLGPNLSPGTQTTYLPGFGVNNFSSNPYDINSAFNEKNRFWMGGAGLTIEQDLGVARLVSISAFRKYKYSTGFNATASVVPTIEIDFDWKGRQFTQELQLVSQGNDRLKWTLGAYYINSQDRFDPINTSLFAPLAGTDPFGNLVGVGTNVLNNKLTAESISGFGQATFEIVDGTRLTGGFRYTYEKRSQAGTSTFLADGFPVGSTTFNDSFSVKKPTWRIAIDQDIGDRSMVYASYNRGFKSGGFNGITPSKPAYRPEKLDAYEIGLKTELLDRTLRLNPAVFYYKYQDIQVSRFNQGNTFIFNGAGAELYGIDLDAQWQATESFKLFGGLEWLHAKFTNFPVADIFTPIPGGGVAGSTGSVTGNRLPYAPKFTFNIGANYSTELAGSKIDLNVSDSYSGKFYGEVDNRLFQKAYHMLNASATATLPGERLSVGIWGRNLLDKLVATQMSTQGPLGDTFDYANAPRTYGVTVRYKFGN